jgi:hypothetical protein
MNESLVSAHCSRIEYMLPRLCYICFDVDYYLWWEWCMVRLFLFRLSRETWTFPKREVKEICRRLAAAVPTINLPLAQHCQKTENFTDRCMRYALNLQLMARSAVTRQGNYLSLGNLFVNLIGENARNYTRDREEIFCFWWYESQAYNFGWEVIYFTLFIISLYS